MSETDDSLLTQAIGGDADALAALLGRTGPQLRQRLNGRIAGSFRSAFDIDDVLQVTYLEAFLRIEQFVPEGSGSFLAWLTRIAENNLRDAVKELSRAKRPPRQKRVTGSNRGDSYTTLLETIGGSLTTASRRAQRHEIETMLGAVLDKLPPDYRKVIHLCELEGRAASSVAEILDRSVGAVYMLRARALTRLRELLPSESKFFGGSP